MQLKANRIPAKAQSARGILDLLARILEVLQLFFSIFPGFGGDNK
jgi:hypothetical protein